MPALKEIGLLYGLNPQTKVNLGAVCKEVLAAYHDPTDPGDLERAKAFYAKHFGFRFEREMDMGKQGPYCFIEHAGQTIGAMMRRPEPGASRWSFAFRTKGTIGAARRSIESGGGKVLLPPHEVPGGDCIVICNDPQGARAIFIGTPGD